MNRIYNLSQRLIASVLFIGLFLQSCGGGQNQLVPQEKKQLSNNFKLSDTSLVNTGTEIVISGGYLASFYEEDRELKVDLRADEKQPHPNYKGIPVIIERDADFIDLSKLDPTTRQQRIELNRSNSGQLSHVTIRKEALRGGMLEEDDYQEKEKEKELDNDFNNYQRLLEFAMQGDPQSQFVLGERYYESWQQYYKEEDLQEAKKWLGKAAAQGHEIAIVLLAEVNLPPLVEDPRAIQHIGKGKEKEHPNLLKLAIESDIATKRKEKGKEKIANKKRNKKKLHIKIEESGKHKDEQIEQKEKSASPKYLTAQEFTREFTEKPNLTNEKKTKKPAQNLLMNYREPINSTITKYEGSKTNKQELASVYSCENNLLSTTIADGKLQYLKILGQGNFGKVYKAIYQGQKVAVKKLLLNSAKEISEFQEEAKIMATLRHRNIVTFLAFIPWENALVMEYVPGGTLWELLKSKKKISWRNRYQIALDVAKGLQYLHDQNVLHCDLKSENIMLDNKQRAKLTDFGVSGSRTEMEKYRRYIDPGFKGTDGRWLAPELFIQYEEANLKIKDIGDLNQISPEELKKIIDIKSTAAADVYSYGLILWQLGARKQPFEQFPPAVVPIHVSKGNHEEISGDTPTKLAEIIKLCWLPEPPLKKETDTQHRPTMSRIRYKLESINFDLLEREERIKQEPEKVGSLPDQGKERAKLPALRQLAFLKSIERLSTVGSVSKLEEIFDQVKGENGSPFPDELREELREKLHLNDQQRIIEKENKLDSEKEELLKRLALLEEKLKKKKEKEASRENSNELEGKEAERKRKNNTIISNKNSISFHEAAASGNVEIAKFLIGKGANVNAKDEDENIPLAAEQGEAVAQFKLGNMYYAGYSSKIKLDYKQAFQWFEKAARQDHVNARSMVAIMYYFGQGVDVDKEKALGLLIPINANIQELAKEGDSYAQNILGLIYQNGLGVSKDYQKALEWYQKAANQGNSYAQNNLGRMYQNGQEVEKDYQKALEWYQKAADQGFAEAQTRLGLMYYLGQGVEKDYQKALEWLQKAADQGFAEAQITLGLMYYLGQTEDTPREIRKLIELCWLPDFQRPTMKQVRHLLEAVHPDFVDKEKEDLKEQLERITKQKRELATQLEISSKQNEELVGQLANSNISREELENELASLTRDKSKIEEEKNELTNALEKEKESREEEKQEVRAQLAIVDLLIQATERDHEAIKMSLEESKNKGIVPELLLGIKYLEGTVVNKDLHKAHLLFKKAADQGHADAQYHLGLMYANEMGVDKCNQKKAVEWYQKAADQGHANAQCLLGWMYTTGRGVEKEDDFKATDLYKAAIKQGNIEAENCLGMMYRAGKGVKHDLPKAKKHFKHAIKHGHVGAQFNLGQMYENGEVNDDKDKDKEAFNLYQKAAEAGDVRAQFQLGLMYTDGKGTEPNYEEAVKWFKKAADQGHVDAQYHLACMYEHGQGVNLNYDIALNLYRQVGAQDKIELLQKKKSE